MKTILKYAAAIVLTGAVVTVATTPVFARDGRNAAAGIGFVAGALIGAAVANSNNGNYYGPNYGPGPYAYGPVYAEPGYAAPAYRYRNRSGGCWIATDTTRGYGYYGPCY